MAGTWRELWMDAWMHVKLLFIDLIISLAWPVLLQNLSGGPISCYGGIFSIDGPFDGL